MSKMPCSITDDPLNDYSKYVEIKTYFPLIPEIHLEQCENCGCLWEDLQDGWCYPCIAHENGDD